MKNMFHFVKKRGLSLLLALTMCMGMMPMSAFALEGEEGADPPAATETQLDTEETNDSNDTTLDADSPSDDGTDADQPEGENPPEVSDGEGEEQPEGEDQSDDSEDVDQPEGYDGEGEEINVQFVSSDAAFTNNGTTLAAFDENNSNDVDNNSDETAEENGKIVLDPIFDPDEAEELGKTERPGQSDGVSTIVGENGDSNKAPNWDIFYDPETDTYKLSYKISGDATGDQTIDLTDALRLLNQYTVTSPDYEKYQNFVSEMKQYEENLANYQSTIKKYEDDYYNSIEFMRESEEYAEYKEEFDRYTKEYEAYQAAYDKYQEDLNQYAEDIEKYQEDLSGYQEKMDAYQAGIAEVDAFFNQSWVINWLKNPSYTIDRPYETWSREDKILVWSNEYAYYGGACPTMPELPTAPSQPIAPVLNATEPKKPALPEGAIAPEKPDVEKPSEPERPTIDMNRTEANVLQPGDIRKFEIYITSDSGHTYSYKNGSFTLATPSFGVGDTGFDGQVIPDEYLEKPKDYHVNGSIKPLRDMLCEVLTDTMTVARFDKYKEDLIKEGKTEAEAEQEAKETIAKEAREAAERETRLHHTMEDLLDWFENPHGAYLPGTKEEILKKLNCNEDDLLNGVCNYLIQYYSTDDVKYSSLKELFESCPEARADLASTDNEGPGRVWTYNGQSIDVIASDQYLYNKFYQSLLSFAYRPVYEYDENGKLKLDENGNPIKIADPLKDVTGNQVQQPGDGSFNYEHPSWTYLDNQEYALEYYMAHKTAWDEADRMFQELLKMGVSKDSAGAAAFAMAINLDGRLADNHYQLTKWGWYNSIQLEQMDIDFSLEKTDTEGNVITSSETEFQIYYIDKVKDEDGNESDVCMYCTYDPESNSYTFVPTESTVRTTNGTLDINYAMMKNIVYYLEEVVAPEGYDRDLTIYIITEDEEQAKAAQEAWNNYFKPETDRSFAWINGLNDATGTEGAYSTANGGVSLKVKFVNPTTPPTPPTPTTPDDPTTPTTPPTTPDTPEIPDEPTPLAEVPEEPAEELTEVPEEEVPLAEIPEEEVPLAELPDPEVPLADVPQTGDSGVFSVFALFALSCGSLLALRKRKEEEA